MIISSERYSYYKLKVTLVIYCTMITTLLLISDKLIFKYTAKICKLLQVC